MRILIETSLIAMFTSYHDHMELAPGELPAAYEEFVSLLTEIADDDRIRHLRRLNFTKIELVYLKNACDEMSQGRHVLYDIFINKSLALLEMEIQLAKDFFIHTSTSFKVEQSKKCSNEKKVTSLTWNGTDSDLIELVAALMAAGTIGSTEGKKVTVMDVIKVFEEAFHLKINALYTKRGKVFDRCTDTTPFIDSLRNSYNRMLKERLA